MSGSGFLSLDQRSVCFDDSVSFVIFVDCNLYAIGDGQLFG